MFVFPLSHQGLSKFVFVNDIRGLVEIAEFIGDIYEKNKNTSNKRDLALFKRFANISELVFKMGFIAYVVMAVDVTVPSLYQSIFNGKMVMSLRLYLPVLDETQEGLQLSQFRLFDVCYFRKCTIDSSAHSWPTGWSKGVSAGVERLFKSQKISIEGTYIDDFEIWPVSWIFMMWIVNVMLNVWEALNCRIC